MTGLLIALALITLVSMSAALKRADDLAEDDAGARRG